MGTKRFRHLGEDWEVTGLGTGHSVGFGFAPANTSWTALFQCISKPELGEFRGSIPETDPAQISDEALRQALEPAFVVHVLRRSKFPWRTAESLSEETGVNQQRVYRILEWESDDVVQADSLDEQGRVLYAVRERYAESTPFFKRYLDVLNSSST